MQARTVLIWIVIAGILGTIVVLTRPNGPSSESTPTSETWRSLGIDPARVLSVTRTIEGQPDQVIERSGAGGEGWVVRWGSGEQHQSWPADARRVRAGNRNLSTQRIAATDAEALENIAGAVRIVDTDGRSIEIAFGTGAVGGYVPIRVDERDNTGIAQSRWFGRIESKVHDAFLTTGFLPWRSDMIFAGTRAQIDAVSLAAGQYHVALERDAGGWSIVEPFKMRASSDKANELVGALLGIESVGFVDVLDEGILNGFASPIATITMRQGTDTTTVRIGSQADMGGQQVFAKVETPTGNAIVKVLAEQLGKLTATPEAYINQIPVNVSVSSLARIEILGKDGKPRFNAQRQLGQWQIDGAVATVQYEEAIDRLVRVLTSEPASGTKFLGADETAIETMGSIQGFDSEGRLAIDVGFGLDSSDAGLRLLIVKALDNADQVLWICTSDEAGGTGAWLTAMVSRRAP